MGGVVSIEEVRAVGIERRGIEVERKLSRICGRGQRAHLMSEIPQRIDPLLECRDVLWPWDLVITQQQQIAICR